MLPDRIFFPLIALILAGMIWVALAFGPTASDPAGPFSGNPKDGLLVKGKYLAIMQNGPGITHELVKEPDGETILRAAAGQRSDEAPSAGVFITVPPKFAKAWEGHTLSISVKLRQPEDNPSSDVFLRYYAIAGGNSSPANCEVSPQWQECNLVYKMPRRKSRTGTQFIGIWPDALGLSRWIDIGALQVKLLSDDQPVQPAPSNDPSS